MKTELTVIQSQLLDSLHRQIVDWCDDKNNEDAVTFVLRLRYQIEAFRKNPRNLLKPEDVTF